MSAIQLFDLNGEQRFTGTSVGGGGSQPSTLTLSLTTSVSTFFVRHVFDLGHATTAYAKATITAITPDGETFGNGPGQLHVSVDITDAGGGIAGGLYRDAADPIPGGLRDTLHTTQGIAVADFMDFSLVVPKLAAFYVALFDDNGAIYAGANHPLVTVRFDFEYV